MPAEGMLGLTHSSAMFDHCTIPSSSHLRLQYLPFRFSDLPKKLRILTLELTGRICSQPIDWGLDGFRVFSREDFWSDCQSHFMNYDPKKLCNLRPLTSSTMCQCLIDPSALFLVDHEAANLAREVFYSRNHFLVGSSQRNKAGVTVQGDAKPSYIWPGTESDRLPCFDFLHSMQPQHVTFLRSLAIFFFSKLQSSHDCMIRRKPSLHDYLQPGCASHRDWVEFIELLARYADLPKLTLSITLIGYGSFTIEGMPPQPDTTTQN